MQTAGNLIVLFVEFSAGMETCQNELQSAYMFRRMHVDRNSASIIDNTANVVFFERNSDCVAVSRHSLVDAVVNNFVHKMMETIRTSGTDIHTWAFTYCLKTF